MEILIKTTNKITINKFLKANEKFNLLTFDFGQKQALKKLHWPAELKNKPAAQKALLTELSTLQRLSRLTEGKESAKKLHDKGFTSALQIASCGLDDFVKRSMTCFQGDEQEATARARQVYQRAVTSKSQSVQAYMAIAQQTEAYYRSGRFNNLTEISDDSLGGLPNYQNLFGDTDFCNCEQCRSIFSPAAYFVDLMRLQANYIQVDTKPSLAIPLKTRRPDLWNIPLDCENTNTVIPKLRIVNQVLANTVHLPYDAKNGTYNYEKLATTNYPFNLPFHLPLTQIRSYLDYYKTDLVTVWRQLASTAIKETSNTNIVREQLALSPQQWQIYTTVVTASKTLLAYYGLTPGSDPNKTLASLNEVAIFLKQTKLSYLQLSDLLFQDLSDAEIAEGLNADFFINVGKAKPIVIDTKSNQLTNVTLARLDHINRFVRLAQALNWSFADLDWALRVIGNIMDKGVPVINATSLGYLAWMQRLQQQCGFTVEQMSAWLGELKESGVKEQASFFQRVFNAPQVMNPPSWPSDKLVWTVANLGDASVLDDTAQQLQNALAAALQLSQDDLLAIADIALTAQSVSNRQLPLNNQNLAILYRLSQLPLLTGQSIKECFSLLNLPGLPQQGLLKLAGVAGDEAQAQLVLLSQISQWLATTKLSVAKLSYLLTGYSDDKTIQNSILGVDAITNFVTELQQAMQPAYLTQQVFIDAMKTLLQALGQNDSVSKLWQAFTTQNKLIDSQGLVTQVVTQAQIAKIVAASLSQNNQQLEDELVTVVYKTLTHFYLLQQQTFNQRLASLYNVSPKLVPVIKLWGGLTIGSVSSNKPMQLYLNDVENSAAAVPLLQLILTSANLLITQQVVLQESNEVVIQLQLLQRYAVLMQELQLSPAEAQSILENPQYYGITYKHAQAENYQPQFTLDNIQSIYQFKQLVAVFHDTQNRLLNYFNAVKKNPNDLTEAAKLLAQFTQWPSEQITLLLTTLWPQKSKATAPAVFGTVAGMTVMQNYFDLAQTLHVDIKNLIQLNQLSSSKKSIDYTTYQNMAQCLWAGLSQYHNAQERQTVVDRLNEKKRDALMALAIFQLNVSTHRELYEYLLLDVEVSSAVKTSYVKEAISAVQLYISRCRNHLELGISVAENLQQWWQWLEHYRVWQANREVFLYPENYIQPELRNNKTPEFTQLISQLKQANLNQASNVEAAFRQYMQSFIDVAGIEIISSNSRQQSSGVKQLCFIGRTRKQPYHYYYRFVTLSKTSDTQSEARYVPVQWQPWQKINLQIKAAGAVTALFAFSKWFLFWVEEKQAGSDEQKQSSGNKKTYTATISYSYLDFNQSWIAPQMWQQTIALPMAISSMSASDKPFWSSLYPAFLASSNTIICNYGKAGTAENEVVSIFQLAESSLSQHLGTAVLFSVAQPMRMPNVLSVTDDAANTMHYQYMAAFGELPNFLFKNKKLSYAASVYTAKIKVFAFSVAVGYLYAYPDKDTVSLNKGKDYKDVWLISAISDDTFIISIASDKTDKTTLYLSADEKSDKVFLSDSINHAYTSWQLKPSKAKGLVNLYNVAKKEMLGIISYSNIKLVVSDKELTLEFKLEEKFQLQPLMFSCACWVKITSLPKSKTTMPVFSLSPGNELAVDSAGYVGAVGSKLSDSTLKINQWYHLVLIDDKKTIALWINGQKQKKSLSAEGHFMLSQETFYLGDNYEKQKFQGAIQEFLLYEKALDENAVMELYNNSKQQIAEDIQEYVNPKEAFDLAVTQLPITGQPNWYVAKAAGIECLALPYKAKSPLLDCIRLNTTASETLSQQLFIQGIPGLLETTTQRSAEIPFAALQPNTKTVPTAYWPADQIDFTSSAMSQYYWEIFFHAPLLIARELDIQQQFAQAKSWYEYIFNPTIDKTDWDLQSSDKDSNDKYWRFLGLRSYNNPVLAKELAESWADEVKVDLTNQAQLYEYHNDPFDPQAIARLRPIAYQKTLLMHYINNLLSWGDSLFRLYTIEDIIQATMLYVTAYDLLGKQPTNLGACALPKTETLSSIAKDSGGLSDIAEFLIQIEQKQSVHSVITAQDNPNNYIPNDYFGLPENTDFTAYWDKVQQRLYNIRNGLNIDGIKEQLPLFQPPINPMQLVKQFQSGNNIENQLPGLQVATPYYRFEVLIEKAKQTAQLVTQFGQSLLSALEKKDAEQLSLLSNTSQQQLSALMSVSKQDELNVSTESLNALQASLQNAKDRVQYYTTLLQNGLSAAEVAQLELVAIALELQTIAQPVKAEAIPGYLVPKIYGLADGGMEYGQAINQGANILEGSANASSMAAGLAGSMAGYQRRDEDWQLQQSLAQADVEQIQYQIVAAQYQQRIATQGIELLEQDIARQQKIERFLKNKFTNQELYQWIVGKLAGLYFQTYQFAYDLAVQAQQAWQFERGSSQTFIQNSYWDNLHHGLAAGEALQLDLQRMESTYMKQNQRAFEIEKVISLAQLDPQALFELRATGQCKFNLTEDDFDYDYIGHYRRQIKTISLSFPAILGPYQNIHATLTQTSSKTLLKDDKAGLAFLLSPNNKKPPPSSILRNDISANQQVALSQGLNDNGLFTLNFSDARYLPFEGTGAISSWNLDMPKANNPFNFASLTDVIIRVQYTALQGNSDFSQAVSSHLKSKGFTGFRTLLMAQENTLAWNGFIQKQSSLSFDVSASLFRPNLSSYKVFKIRLQLQLTQQGKQAKFPSGITLGLNIPGQKALNFKLEKATDGTVSATLPLPSSTMTIPVSTAQKWEINIASDSSKFISATNISNLFVSLSYQGGMQINNANS